MRPPASDGCPYGHRVINDAGLPSCMDGGRFVRCDRGLCCNCGTYDPCSEELEGETWCPACRERRWREGLATEPAPASICWEGDDEVSF